MEINQKKICLINPNLLVPLENHSEERVKWLQEKVLEDREWKTAIAVAIEHNLIMDGHHRRQVALNLGLKFVPCLFFSYKKIEVKSLRENEYVSSEHIMEKFRSNKKIYPYKTAKHDLPELGIKDPVKLIDLK